MIQQIFQPEGTQIRQFFNTYNYPFVTAFLSMIERQDLKFSAKCAHTRGKTLDTQPYERYRFVLIAKRIAARQKA